MRLSNNNWILCFLILTVFQNAQSQDFQSFLDHVNGLMNDQDKNEAVDSFINAVSEFPYIEGDDAYFVYVGEATSVKAVGDFNSWSGSSAYSLDQLGGTDFWHHQQTFESNARLDYKLIINNTDWILDPLNPNTVAGGFGSNSELAMPDYIQPWEIESNPGIDHGTVSDFTISSAIANRDYQLKIYLPPNYNAGRNPGYAVAYFQDGFETVSLGKGVIVMDNLIDAQLIDEIIGVFVRPNDRAAEYSFDDRFTYRDFFVDELVPYIDQNYNTVYYPNHRAVIGASYGGNISAHIAYTHPEVFGNCGIHSGALSPNGNEVFNLITNGPKVDVKMANIWGSYEGLATQMAALSNHFESESYDYISSELPEGHSWGLWRSTLDDMLEFFFGYLTTSADQNELVRSIELYHDSASSTVLYAFELESEISFAVKLIDMSGKTVHHRNYRGIGRIEGQLDVSQMPAGIYSFTLEMEGDVQSHTLSIVR